MVTPIVVQISDINSTFTDTRINRKLHIFILSVLASLGCRSNAIDQETQLQAFIS